MKYLATRIFSVMMAGLLAFAGAAWADTLELKDGRLMEGKYMGGTSTNVRFQVDGRTRLYRVSDVVAVTFGDQVSSYEPTGTTYPAYRGGSAVTSTQRATSRTVVVPAQTRLKVRMIDGVDSETNKVGDEFRATLEEDLMVNSQVAAWRGSEVRGQLVQVEDAGRITGRSELTLRLSEIEVNGRLYPLATSAESNVEGKSRSKDSALKIGGGAALGAIIGAIAGGGKGAAIGAVIGGGAGTAVQVLTKGEKVRVPSETVLEFVLQEDARLPANTSSRPAR